MDHGIASQAWSDVADAAGGAAVLTASGPRVTVPDDDLVRTHDEARELLRYAVPGATVVVEHCRPPAPAWRRVTVVLDFAPHHATSASDAYSLPCKAGLLCDRAKALAGAALKQRAALLRGG